MHSRDAWPFSTIFPKTVGSQLLKMAWHPNCVLSGAVQARSLSVSFASRSAVFLGACYEDVPIFFYADTTQERRRAMGLKEDYQEKLEAQLKEWSRKIDQLKSAA